MPSTRLRDLGLTIGHFPTGPNNAITDVNGVMVGHCTLIYDEPRIARTGITVILPRGEKIWTDYAFAGFYAQNGNGEMTGALWISETGLLCTPIALTNTFQVGIVRDALIEYALEQGYPQTESSDLPVVAETYDGWLNDISAFHLNKEHVRAALADAKPGIVEEGNVGGGTGMTCHEFKGGIGTSSREIITPSGKCALGVLVQANYGDRHLLRVDGIPVGRIIGQDTPPVPWPTPPITHSIIIIIATDAPLLPVQCTRLARRASVGLARVGGISANADGDIFLAFSTGNHIPYDPEEVVPIQMLPNEYLTMLFEAAAEAVQEAILNSLTAAETMTGYNEHTAYALPINRLMEIVREYSF
jgi:D-aminopeptidase